MSARKAELAWAFASILPALLRAIIMLFLLMVMVWYTKTTLEGPSASTSGPWIVSSAVYMIPTLMRQISEDCTYICAQGFNSYFDVFEITSDEPMYEGLAVTSMTLSFDWVPSEAARSGGA